ncbi:hypothetical protein OIO90_005086 [Microbotryomycetes sp. JL221]|nr:hypothetical protein OIO90_005086 [Microbotryomycetes sp. JL221]
MSLPFFRRGGPSTSHVPSRFDHEDSMTPDFGAFDDENDESDNDDASAPRRPMLGSHAPAYNVNDSFDRTPSISETANARQGAISLDNSLRDPLTSHAAQQALATTSTAYDSSNSLPGGYDFEPQGHEGAPITATPRTHGTTSTTSSSPERRLRDEHVNSHRASSSTTLSNLAQRLLPQQLYSRLNHRADEDEDREARSGLLFSQDEHGSSAEGTDADGTRQHNLNEVASGQTYPPSQRTSGGVMPSHVPLPARAPQFARTQHGADGVNTRVFGGGQNNDGVFANLSAKPDNTNSLGYVGGDDDEHKDEVLPAYEVAALDATPPYWETTVITPGGTLGPDDICVDGLPVGNLFGFAWNLLVSMSFQFVGFLLTYLLHTTHAAKNGSRAGLGITMIQLGFYLKQRADHPELFEMPGDLSGLDGTADFDKDDPSNWSWWGGMAPPIDPEVDMAASATTSALGSLPTQVHNALGGIFNSSHPSAMRNATNGMPSLTGQMSEEEMIRMSTAANEWMAFMMITLGSFLIVGAVLSYWRAVRWARAVQQGQGPQTDQESLIGRILAQ